MLSVCECLSLSSDRHLAVLILWETSWKLFSTFLSCKGWKNKLFGNDLRNIGSNCSAQIPILALPSYSLVFSFLLDKQVNPNEIFESRKEMIVAVWKAFRECSLTCPPWPPSSSCSLEQLRSAAADRKRRERERERVHPIRFIHQRFVRTLLPQMLAALPWKFDQFLMLPHFLCSDPQCFPVSPCQRCLLAPWLCFPLPGQSSVFPRCSSQFLF